MKKSKKFEGMAFIIFIICGGIYFYCLHRSFWPDPENLIATLKYLWKERFGREYSYSSIFEVFSFLSYRIFGAGYRGLRVYNTIVYMIILTLTSLMAIWRPDEKSIKWHLLPLLAFIAVLLNPGDSEFCGYHNKIYHVYPYDMHNIQVTVILVATFLIFCILYTSVNKTFKIAMGVLLLAIVVQYKFDVMFIMGFIGPVACVAMVELFKKNRKNFIKCILILFGVLALMRVVGLFIEPIGQFFTKEQLSSAYGKIYGNNGFVDYDSIWSNISITLTEILALFNIELSGYSVLSVNTIIGLVRIGVLLFIICTSVRTIVKSFDNNVKVDYISLIAGYGLLFNILLIMFTYNGSDLRCSRYMTLIVFFGTVVLCRNLDYFLENKSASIDFLKKTVFVFFSLCIVIDASPIWTVNSYKAEYEDVMSDVADIIRYYKLGNGVGGDRYANNLTSLTNGEYVVIEASLTDSGFCLTIPGVEVNYIAQIKGELWDMFYGKYDEEDIFRICGEPDEVFETDDFAIYYYNDGLVTVN